MTIIKKLTQSAEEIIFNDKVFIEKLFALNHTYGAMASISKKFPEIEYDSQRAYDLLKSMKYPLSENLNKGNFTGHYDYHEFRSFWGNQYTNRVIIKKILNIGDKVVWNFNHFSTSWQPRKKSEKIGTICGYGSMHDNVDVKYEDDNCKYSFGTEYIVSINGNKEISDLIENWIRENSHITSKKVAA